MTGPGRAAPVLRYAKGILALLTAAATALIALPAGASWQLQLATGAAAAIGTGLVVLVPNAKPKRAAQLPPRRPPR